MIKENSKALDETFVKIPFPWAHILTLAQIHTTKVCLPLPYQKTNKQTNKQKKHIHIKIHLTCYIGLI